MKKALSTLFAASLLLIGVNASAQFSIGAGYVNSQYRYKTSSSSDVSTTNTNGIAAGIGYTFNLGHGFGVTPGVYYTITNKRNAAGATIFGVHISGESTTTEQYINVPVHLSFGAEINPDFKIFLFAGPSFSAGISSVTKSRLAGGSASLDFDPIDNYEGGDYGRFDLLLGGGIGFDLLKHVRLLVGYDAGMLNRNTDSSSNITRHRNQLYAGAAFLF